MTKHVDLIVMKGGVYLYPGSGAPTNGPSGTLAGKAAPSSFYFDGTNGTVYYNGGTKASPAWHNIGTIAPGAIGLVDGKILIGGADGMAAAKTPTGDVTISNAGVTAIVAKAVSLAKMADIATDKLIGRDTAASGVPEVIGVGGGLEFDGSGNVRVADKGITLAKHADMATDSLIGRDTAAAGAPEVIALGSGLEMSGSGALQVATAGVSKAMLANIGTDRLLGRDTASAGVPEEIALGAGLEFDGSGNIRIADSGVTAAKLAAGAVLDFPDAQNATVVTVAHGDTFPKQILASDAVNVRLALVMAKVTTGFSSDANVLVGAASDPDGALSIVGVVAAGVRRFGLIPVPAGEAISATLPGAAPTAGVMTVYVLTSIQAGAGLWTRSGTVLSPTTAGDVVHAVVETARVSMTGNVTLTAASAIFQFLVLDADRDCTLPTAVTGMAFTIKHAGSSYTLTIKDASATILAVIAAGESATYVYDGAAWQVL